MIRFHLDQHVANAVAHGLRLRGVDVTTTHEAELQDADDLALIAYAHAEGRVTFTQDADFLRHHSAGVTHMRALFIHGRALERSETSFGTSSSCMIALMKPIWQGSLSISNRREFPFIWMTGRSW